MVDEATENHSVSAGLDYPAVGPEHAALQSLGRAEYHGVTDEEALAAFRELSETEGIIPALEPSHAIALAITAVTARKPTGFSRGRKRVNSAKQSTDYSIVDSPTL